MRIFWVEIELAEGELDRVAKAIGELGEGIGAVLRDLRPKIEAETEK